MLIILLLTFVASALAGSQCPPRENIYPCICLSIPQAKQFLFTLVSCHRLPSSDAFNSIFPTLRTMTIDRFYLYDSFWEANNLGKEGEDKQVLPADWLTLLKIKEIEIVDTTLSPCFACHSRSICKNYITTRFTAVNSSSHDKICTICNSSSGSKFSWIGCMNKLKEFHFRHGKLTVLRADLFPLRMTDLTEVDLSYNEISKIENKALQILPKLKVLKLSHNLLESLSGITTTKLDYLQELDVSWNLLKALSPNFFSAFPTMKNLIANNNYFVKLEEEQWKNIPQDYLRNVNLQENPLHCDCNIKWINSTFPRKAVLQGYCASPKDITNSPIRRASKFLLERCTEDGKIGTKKPKSTSSPTTAMLEPV